MTSRGETWAATAVLRAGRGHKPTQVTLSPHTLDEHSLTNTRGFAGERRGRGRGRKRPVEPAWDPDEEWPVEAILDTRLATKDDSIEGVKVGDVLYLVAWEGWDPSYNSWEPEHNVEDSLLEDYNARINEAEDEEAEEALELAEEEAAEAIAAGGAQMEVEVEHGHAHEHETIHGAQVEPEIGSRVAESEVRKARSVLIALR